VIRNRSGAHPARAGAYVLMAALAVELADELVDGTKGAALPLIRQGLDLSYAQIGLLASVPLLLGSLLELPFGLVAGQGRARRRAVLIGGAAFVASLAAAAAAGTFAGLLVAFVAFYPASGAFVGLTQSTLMDAAADRQERHMASWTVAGSAGQVAGPVMLIAVIAAGGGWRAAYVVLAACAGAAWLGTARYGPCLQSVPSDQQSAPGDPQSAPGDPPQSVPGGGDPGQLGAAAAVRRAVSVLRRGEVMRWVVLLEVANLLLDVLTGFVALYLVDVVHATPAAAAIGVAIRLVAMLAGDIALLAVLERAGGMDVLRASVAAAALLYPAFLLVPGLVPKLIVLAVLSFATAPWYTVLQAQLYRSLPGESGVAVSLMSAASLVSGVGPLAVGLVAQRYGLAWALAGLTLAPVGLLGGLRRQRPRAAPPAS
jgi:MFS transporter, FSR family, fosmidomycin resistance protein